MTENSGNSIPDPNPFGPTDERAIIAFESIIGARLPSEYRMYLLKFNGGDFAKDFFKRSGGIDGRIHNIYGLHSGPRFAQLSERWKLSGYFGIGESTPGVDDYLVFASTETGDLLLIDIGTGEVLFLDHEAVRGDLSRSPRLRPVSIASSFDDFVAGLRSG